MQPRSVDRVVRSGARAPLPAAWAALLAVAAGVTGTFAFPEAGIWPLAFVSVAGLSVAVDGCRSRRGAWLGLLYGLAFMCPLIHWTGVYVGAVPWLILSVAEAAYFAGLGAVLARVQRLPVAPLWVGSAWVLEEFVRDRAPFGGFPWGRLAFSQAASVLKWFAALGGAPLVSFAVAVGGAALALAVRHVRPLGVRPLVAALAVVVMVPALGALLSWPVGAQTDGRGKTAVVALIQGSVPDRGLDFEDRAGEVLDNHIAQTLKLAAEIRTGAVPKPDLVVWPENASDLDPFGSRAVFDEIDNTVRTLGVPVLVGAILQGPGADHRRNAGILWSPVSGPGAQYIKRHPVPFAEYMPMRGLAEWVSSDAKLVTQDMVAGHGNGLLKGGPFPIGDVICFEVAYDSLVQSSVAAGAQLLVVQTNNATFGHTAETYQQLAMSRLRAVETGRSVVQAATTGKSAIINPHGELVRESGALFRPAILTATLRLQTGTTLAVRLGAAPEYALAALALVALGWSLWPAWRRTARRWHAPAVAGDAPGQHSEDEVVAT